MAALVSSSIPLLFSQNPRNHKSKPLQFFSLNPNPNLNNPHRLSFTPRNPSSSLLTLTILNPRKLRSITDEWGEKSDPEPEPASKPDPPKEDDEWGKDLSPSAKITDEWGEKSDPDPEAASETDPPRGEDEWGKEASSGSEPEPEPDSDKLGDLKRCLVDNLYGTEYGLRASAEVRAEIFELVSQLEAENPTPAPNETAEFLDGNWILL